MKMEPKSLLAIVLCILFYLGYTSYINNKYPNYSKIAQNNNLSEEPLLDKNVTQQNKIQPIDPEQKVKSTSVNPEKTAMKIQAPEVFKLSDSELSFDRLTSLYKIDQEGGGFSQVILKKFYDKVGKDKKHINLVNSALFIQPVINSKSLKVSLQRFSGKRQADNVALSRVQDGFLVTQKYSFGVDKYKSVMSVSFKNLSQETQQLQAGVLIAEKVKFHKSKTFLPGIASERPIFIYGNNDNVEREDLEAFCSDDDNNSIQLSKTKFDFIGLDHHYFLKSFKPHFSADLFMNKISATENNCDVGFILSQDMGRIKSGESITLDFDLYFGPKTFSDLKAVDKVLEKSVDLGFFSMLARPLLVVLQGFYTYLGNFGVAIIVMTILLKLLFFPLMKASTISMYKMKQLNPQMKDIRERNKNDKVKQQQELMQFMSKHKINPAKGCLPMLPQIPVFFAFYQMLANAIELRHKPFFGWIQDLTIMDPYFIIPVLMGVAMFMQQKLNPSTGMDKTQEKVMMFMPVIFSLMMFTLPAGLTLYFLTNTVVSIVQQKWLYHKLDQQNTKQTKGVQT